MNNVIPLKRPEHVISDVELDRLAIDIARFANNHAGTFSLSHGIRKLLSDALKRDKRDGEDNIPPAG
ncbi:hypothetical protein MHZ90_18110 [Pantoea sp. ACRSH]|uniref:hypothetical protein n=1 Tax=unclassified Pantoea TaxID=2630326 RepID=UPI001EF6E20E|nr:MULTISPECIES: hypothetical protein [unclassified Pantoea]MCG7368027.1 hypothetical protein [Pantoea sp. ACRSH]MCG7398386.1 hypothetical protein [Pantoea sp. ACRSC]